MRVLVTGGAGYIGSVVVEQLQHDGHTVLVFDNLSNGHREIVPDDVPLIKGELLDVQLLADLLSEQRIEAVMHLAASSLVGESVADPEKYYSNNMVGSLSVLSAMRVAGVTKIVFSSSAAVYGEPVRLPIKETDPTEPTNPYGETKLACERALNRHHEKYGLSYASLRYFNAAGATDRCGEVHDPETHLIPLVLQVASAKCAELKVYGDDYATRDGTCIRDYVHVSDLARAHLLALYNLGERGAIFNLGCGGDGYSVKEVVDCAAEVTGSKIPLKIAPRRPGDPAVLIASSEKIKRELGWEPKLQNLRTIIESAWAWYQKHPNGYR